MRETIRTHYDLCGTCWENRLISLDYAEEYQKLLLVLLDWQQRSKQIRSISMHLSFSYRIKREENGINLENMKCFKLNIFAFLFQEIHLLFEIVRICDKFRHHRKIISIKEQFAEQLQTKDKSYRAKYSTEFTRQMFSNETSTLNRSNTSRLYISKAERVMLRTVLLFKTKASDGNNP